MRVQLIVPRTGASEQQPFDCPDTQAAFYTAAFTVQKQCRERWTDGIAPWAGSPKVAPNTADDLDTDTDLWVFGETEEKVRTDGSSQPKPQPCTPIPTRAPQKVLGPTRAVLGTTKRYERAPP